MAMYRCRKCSFLYIDEKNDTPFEDLDQEKFRCPRCKCRKSLFEKVQS